MYLPRRMCGRRSPLRRRVRASDKGTFKIRASSGGVKSSSSRIVPVLLVDGFEVITVFGPVVAFDTHELYHAPPSLWLPKPPYMDHKMERIGNVCSNRGVGKLDARHQDAGGKARERLARGAGMDRGKRSRMTGIHGLQEIERLLAPNLAQKNPIRPHAQCSSQ